MENPSVFLIINLVIIPVLEAAVIGWSLGAFTMQAAASFGGVEELGFFKAGALTTLLALLNFPIFLGIYFLLLSQGFKGLTAEEIILGAEAGGVVVQVLISGAILSLLLQVHFLKGLMIALLQFFISLVILGVLGCLFLVVLSILQISSGNPH